MNDSIFIDRLPSFSYSYVLRCFHPHHYAINEDVSNLFINNAPLSPVVLYLDMNRFIYFVDHSQKITYVMDHAHGYIHF